MCFLCSSVFSCVFIMLQLMFCFFGRAVEKHLQTFVHREKKKVTILSTFLFNFLIYCSKLKFIYILNGIACSFHHSLIGLAGALGMPFTPMSLRRVCKRA